MLEIVEIFLMDIFKLIDFVFFCVFVNVMEGLYCLDKDNKLILGMVKDVKISEDKKIYIFELCDVKWLNGDLVWV